MITWVIKVILSDARSLPFFSVEDAVKAVRTNGYHTTLMVFQVILTEFAHYLVAY